MKKAALGAVVLLLSTQNGFGDMQQSFSQKKDKDKELSLTLSGKMLFDSFLGNQTEKRVYTFRNNAAVTTGSRFSAQALSAPEKGRPNMFAVDSSKVNFEGKGKSGEWTYILNVTFSGDKYSFTSVREIYGSIEHPGVGILIFGDTRGVEDRSAFGPSDFLAGTGGTDGNFFRFINLTTGLWMAPSIVGDSGYSTKVEYYTPRLRGFQVGVSFSPNTQHMGEAMLRTDSSYSSSSPRPFDLESTCAGINYVYQRNNMSLSLSALGIFGKTQPALHGKPMLAANNTRSYDLGFVLGLGPWEIGAEYIMNGKSGTYENSINSVTPQINNGSIPLTTYRTLPTKAYEAGKATKNWSINCGIGYTSGPARITLGYFRTQRNTGFRDLTTQKIGKASGYGWVVSTDYKIATGLVPYVEAAYYHMKNQDWAYMAAYSASALGDKDVYAVPSNKAKVVLGGIKVQF